MKTKYYKVLNAYDETSCATKFDEAVDFAKRIELTELLRMNNFKMVEIEEEEYNKIPNKIDAI